MKVGLPVCLFGILAIFGFLEASPIGYFDEIGEIEPLQCDDTTLEEERAHSTSCEILMDALYDLEMSGSAIGYGHSPTDQTSVLQNQRHRESGPKSSKNRVVRRRRDGGAPNATTSGPIGQPNNPPFFPSANMTQHENEVRLQVCRSLLQLPGVRRRCCTTLWVTCPEYGPDAPSNGGPPPGPPPPQPPAPLPPPPPPPPPSAPGLPFPLPFADENESIYESSGNTSPVQTVLKNVANNLVGALATYVNGQTPKQPLQPLQGLLGNGQG